MEVLGIGFITEDNLTHLAQIIHDKLEKHEEREVERIGLCICFVPVNSKKFNEASVLSFNFFAKLGLNTRGKSTIRI